MSAWLPLDNVVAGGTMPAEEIKHICGDKPDCWALYTDPAAKLGTGAKAGSTEAILVGSTGGSTSPVGCALAGENGYRWITFATILFFLPLLIVSVRRAGLVLTQ